MKEFVDTRTELWDLKLTELSSISRYRLLWRVSHSSKFSPAIAFIRIALLIQCAVKRCWSTVGERPTRELVRSTR